MKATINKIKEKHLDIAAFIWLLTAAYLVYCYSFEPIPYIWNGDNLVMKVGAFFNSLSFYYCVTFYVSSFINALIGRKLT